MEIQNHPFSIVALHWHSDEWLAAAPTIPPLNRILYSQQYEISQFTHTMIEPKIQYDWWQWYIAPPLEQFALVSRISNVAWDSDNVPLWIELQSGELLLK